MAFVLALATPTQSNDALTISFVDASTTWGVDYAYPDGVTTTLSMGIAVQTFDGSTTFDTITDASFFNDYDTADRTFLLTAPLLKVSGTSSYTSDDMLPDGLYTVTYKYLNGATVVATYQITMLVTGQVTMDNNLDFVYSPNQWDKSEIKVTSDDMMKLLEPIRKYSLRKALYSEPYQSSTTKMLNALELLTRLITNLEA